MAKSVKGSAFIADDGGVIFTPYETGNKENFNWLQLKAVENGKLECSKKYVRVTITVKRADIGAVCSSFSTALGKLISAFMTDKKIQSFYLKAKDMKPYEVDENLGKTPDESIEEEQPMHGY